MGSRDRKALAGWRRALPADDADELTWLLFRQEEVISLRQALRHLSRKTIRHRVDTRRWRQEWRVHVEIDGGQHFDPRQAWADMLRQNALWVDGDRVLRFPSWAVRARPEEVIAQLRAALRAAGWPG
ncbi:DUF559 domain-containing protein [Micromonospora sp. RTGN7]|uniref:DUF559 domain-containing protein n=1 Tax=Micromonospora sp. RTGN7 TaxID=3016526 RepID=UPI0029FF4F57|nr:DUF559 domain-containing protein [Micromonospora sp. RTGN7]